MSHFSRIPILVIIIILGPQMQPLEIEQITNTTGIYFDSLGTVSVYQSTWTLIIHYDLTPFHAEYQTLAECLSKLKKLCVQLETAKINNRECYSIYGQLTLQLKEIEGTQQFILPHSSRTKRSLMDAGGSLLNYVIGTLDQNYKVANDLNINNLKNRQDFLSALIKNHTSILENTSSLIQKSEQDVKTI